MIVVDTSALIAILQREELGPACMTVLEREAACMSAGTLAEASVVTLRRNLSIALKELLAGLDVEIVSVDAEQAQAIGDAYRLWGKGKSRAQLNLGDCFAYTLAIQRNAPLLYIGQDFARTDVLHALPLA